MPVLSFRVTEAEVAAYKCAGQGEFLPMATWARRTLNVASKVNAPAKPVDHQSPAGPLNPARNRVMHGGERMNWEAYFAGRLTDNNGPDGAPQFAAVLRSPHAADPEAHLAYGKAMEECFARGEPVQPGADHAWTTYLREHE